MKILLSVMCVGVILVVTSTFAQDKGESCAGAKVVMTNAVVKRVSKPDRQKYYSGLSDTSNIKNHIKNYADCLMEYCKKNPNRVGFAVMGLYFLLKGILGGKKDSKDEN